MTVAACMQLRNKLDYHAQADQYNFATLCPINLKLFSLCSICSAEYSNVLGWINNQAEAVESSLKA